MSTRKANPHLQGDLPHCRQFASDNYAPMCPEAWAAMEAANTVHVPAYGNDSWTQEAADLIREVFEAECEVFFVFNGTAANSLALASLCQSYHSILCHELAHVETDECGAPEFYSNGTKVLTVGGSGGKVTPDAIERMVRRRSDIHYPKPRAVSLTQSTEVGTVYSRQEIQAVCSMAKSLGLRVHMDGARFANAVASLEINPGELTWRAGVDVLSFGGTKNGAGIGEAVVFFDRELAGEFAYRCKQAGQLASKMRYLSAPWIGMLQDGVWLRHAAHANLMAKHLEAQLRELAEVKVLFPCAANAVFAELPPVAVEAMWKRGWQFYTFIGQGGCRLMCAWDTTEVDVNDFVADLKSAL